VRFDAIRAVLGEPEDRSFGSAFGMFVCKRWPCGCERIFSADGREHEDVFAPCREHENLFPGWRDKVRTDIGPRWETTLLRRKGQLVKLRACKPGDTVKHGKVIYLVEPSPKWASDHERSIYVWVTNLHPAKTRGRFVSIGSQGAACADQEVYLLNAPHERYDFDEEGRLIED
jgi:hypothetical protein